MARAIEVPVVAKKGTLARSIEGEAATAFRNLGRSSGAVAPLGRMLGKIRADADEFTKSIEASNARVIAFGASVGVINGISNAFKELVRVTVSVEKSLTDINVVLNANQSQLTKFGDGLFKVAKNTAQSFDVVAEAATEFARQGLGIEETLKRTNDALILTRLTGLKAAESVKGLTAATNGFAKAGLNTTQIINKLAAVDVKFAVSADDLIAALSRTGAVAQEAGLSMDELIGMVTAAQQVTARGGPVIGNAFKTIFTRVQRPETLKTLRELKIAVEDTSGAALPASKVLQNLATSYDGLSRSAKDAVNQQVAGVFQINILKAAIGDLQKQNSIAARATAVSANATDQAAKKNEMLNQTIAALSTQTGLALTELAKKIGDISIAPGMRDLIGSFKALVEGTTGVLDGEGTGSRFAQGLLKGIGNVLTGPGLIVIGGVFIKLFKDLTVFGMNSLKNLLGLNNAAKQQAALQQGIGTLLQTNTAYQTQIAAAAGNVNKQAAITQRFLQQEIAMRQQAAALTSGMAGAAFMGGFRVDKAGDLTKKKRGLRGMVPGLAPTEVPSFSRLPVRLPLGISTGDIASGKTFGISGNKLAKKMPKAFKAAAERMDGFDINYADVLGLSAQGQASMIGGMRSALGAPGYGAFGRGQMIPGIDPNLYGASTLQGLQTAMKAVSPKARGLFDQKMAEQVTEPFLASHARGSGSGVVGLLGGRQGQDTFFDALRLNPDRTYTPIEIKKRLSAESTKATMIKKSLFSETNKTVRNAFFNAAESPGELKAMKAHIFSELDKAYGVYANAGIPGFGDHTSSMGRVKAVKRFHKAVNFAPIGDAIKREKHQVGGLLGINPSQVKTKVIQNTALRSSFNPGGFGVISPTIGQNNFADARRMHKGEDLRTANLPNFMTPLPVAGIGPLGGRKPLSMTPVGYTETIKAIITGVEDEPAKKLGTSTAKALTRPTSPMATGLSRDDILGRTRAIRDERGLKTLAAGQPGGLGAGAMNAFMGYSMGTMVDPLAQDFLGVGEGVLPGAIGGGILGRAAGKSLAARALSVGARGARFLGPVGTAAGIGVGALAGAYSPEDREFYLRHRDPDSVSNVGRLSRDMLGVELPTMGEFRSSFGIKADSEGTFTEKMKERFRSQIEMQRLNQLNRIQSDKVSAISAGRDAQLTQIRGAAGVGLAGRSGRFSALELARRSTAVEEAARAGQRQQSFGAFIGDTAQPLVTKASGFAYEGGGANELRIRNLINENFAQGNFQAVDDFFQAIKDPDKRMTSNLQILREGVGIKGGTHDFSGIETRGFFASGFADSLEQERAGIVNRATRTQMTSGGEGLNIDDNLKTLAQSKNFSALAVDVKKAAQSFQELKDSTDFADQVADLNNEIAETAAAMENVNRFTSGFSSSFASAFSNITTGASSAKNAMMDFGISVFGAINKIQSERIAQSLTGALFPEGGKSEGFLKGLFGGNQKGGLIKAQNGMYISGGRTGDKNPALLEDGEYVLNRNAVKALGGPSAIDGLNFGVAPRFQSGGRLASPIAAAGVRSSSLNKIIEENEFLPPMAGMGTALGGGGASVRLGITDPRLSGFAHANDPVLQNVRADVQKYHERRRQKKFESQAKKDELLRTAVSAVVTSGLNFGIDKAKGAFKNKKLTKQALADEGAVFGEGFDFGPLMTAPSGSAHSSPGYNMIPGHGGRYGGRRLGPGDQAGMMLPMPQHSRDHMNALAESRTRLVAGEKFRGAVSPMGPHGGTPGAIMDTMRKQGIKGGDRRSMGSFFQGLVDSIANKYGIIGSPNVPAGAGRSGFTPSQGMIDAAGGYGHGNQAPGARMGNTNQGIINMLNRGRDLHDNIIQLDNVGPINDVTPYEFKKTPKKIEKDKHGNVIIEYQRGGHIDNIPAMLTGGEFVVNPSTVRRHGSAFFSKLNRGGRIGYQTGGLVGDQQFVPAQGDTQNNNNNQTQNENNATSNTTINITVNGSSGESNSDGENAGTEQRQMATQLQDAVLTVLKQQKRTGGMLRDVTSNDQ